MLVSPFSSPLLPMVCNTLPHFARFLNALIGRWYFQKQTTIGSDTANSNLYALHLQDKHNGQRSILADAQYAQGSDCEDEGKGWDDCSARLVG